MANERKRVSLPIVGINRSEPDHSVTDGACDELTNLRFAEGAWRNTAPCKKLISCASNGGNTIVYKHPAAPEMNYIARIGDQLREVKFVPEGDSGDYRLEVTQELFTIPDGATVKISHFGSVLILRVEPEKKMYYFFYQGEEYRLFSIPEPPDVRSTIPDGTSPYAMIMPDMYFIEAHSSSLLHDRYAPIPDDGNLSTDAFCCNVFNLTSGEVLALANDRKDDHWMGEIALFAVFRMKDGTTLSSSALRIFDSTIENTTQASFSEQIQVGCYVHGGDYNENSPVYLLARKVNETAKWSNVDQMGTINNYKRIKPTVVIDIKGRAVDTELIDRVTIYSTRIKPPFDYAAIQSGKLAEYARQVRDILKDSNVYTPGAFVDIKYSDVWDDNKNLLEEPFYRLKDINISDFTDGSYNLTLSYDIFNNIEHNPVYEPNQSLNQVFGDVYFEYNSRVHLANVQTSLFKGYFPGSILHYTGFSHNSSTVTTLHSGHETKYLTKTQIGMATDFTGTGIHRTRVLSFPDYRAKKLEAYVSDNLDPASGGWIHDSRDYLPNEAANFAFIINPPQEDDETIDKYPGFSDFNRSNAYDPDTADATGLIGPLVRYESLPDDNILDEPGRIQVSGLNNPLSMPFELSYSVGDLGNKIIALNAISDQLSDSKFGEYPLMAFTSQGVFALQNGSGDVVYASVIQINRDVIVGPNTLAARHFVFYGTARGLMAIQGRESALVSEPIHRIVDNAVSTPDGNAILDFQHRNNEVIVQWGDSIFCFSLTHKFWYLRDSLTRGEGNAILNNNQITDTECNVYDLEAEEMDGAPVGISVLTRPIKLGSVEFKRIESFIIRMQSAEKCDVSFRLEGSNDKKNWMPLRAEDLKIDNDVTLRRTPLSCKFFRIVMTGETTQYITLNNFDIEFYHKYLHRMR